MLFSARMPVVPLWELKSPAAVPDTGDIVEEVVADNRAALVAESVDAAHVAEDRAVAVGERADVMDVVPLDPVARRQRRTVAPRPGDEMAV